jgi:uncharacterized tellurite resistance protein B-like protein
MGLFDMFKTEPPKLTPKLALATGLLFMMAADGQIEEEEIGHLQSVLGSDEQLIQSAIKYLRAVPYDQFLTEANALLNPQQKLCVLVNMADSLLSDGRAAPSEQNAFNKALAGAGSGIGGYGRRSRQRSPGQHAPSTALATAQTTAHAGVADPGRRAVETLRAGQPCGLAELLGQLVRTLPGGNARA